MVVAIWTRPVTVTPFWDGRWAITHGPPLRQTAYHWARPLRARGREDGGDGPINPRRYQQAGWLGAGSAGSRFDKGIYSSLDPKTAMIEAGFNSKTHEFYEASFKPSGEIGESFLVVPSVKNKNGINIVDYSWKSGKPGVADTKPLKKI